MKLQVIFIILAVFPKLYQSVPLQKIEWGVVKTPLNLIVGGDYAFATDFPWHASMFHNTDRGWEYKCGGSLISEQFVLTVKHCIVQGDDPLPVEKLLIKFGLQKYKSESQNSQVRSVSNIYYAKGNLWEEFRNDIALIKLVDIVEINTFVLPVLLVDKEPTPETMGTVVGFGFTKEKNLSESLSKLEMPIIDHRECVQRHNFGMDKGQFCAGYTHGRTACNGDSGGGLVFRKDRKFYLGGLVSYSDREDGSYTCRLDGYSVFTSVYYYLPWINRITKLNASLGTSFNLNKIPCGVSIIKRFRRIVRGQETIPAQWPWHAKIYKNVKNRKEYICGGALINDRFIVTARHCIADHNESNGIISVTEIFVQLGAHKLKDSSRDFYDLKKIYTPPTEVDDMPEIDIALLELSNEVVIFYTDIVRPVCLPVTDVEIGSYGTAIGFGYMENDQVSQILRMAKMPVTNSLTCIRQLRPGLDSLSENNFCAGYSNGTTICNGDSGGGIYFKGVDDAWHIGGIASFSAARESGLCALDKPWVFINVFNFVTWIKSVVTSNGD